MMACFNYLCVIKKAKETHSKKKKKKKKNDTFPFLKKTTALHHLHSTVICHINHGKMADLGTFKAYEQFMSANEPRMYVFEICRKGNRERKEVCNLQQPNIDQYFSLQLVIRVSSATDLSLYGKTALYFIVSKQFCLEMITQLVDVCVSVANALCWCICQ